MRLFIALIGIAFIITAAIYTFLGQDHEESFGTETAFPDTRVQIETASTNVLFTRSGEALPITLPPDEFDSLTDEGSFMTDRSADGFDVLYYAPEGALTVLLLAEPLSESRLAAEDYIMSRFNLSSEKLCDLNARIVTNRFVSNFFADRELGFSSCPGSVQL